VTTPTLTDPDGPPVEAVERHGASLRARARGRSLTDPDESPHAREAVEATDHAAELLAACAARGDLAARWFLRARARGEALPSEEHARRVAELEARDRP
jgi:hypothetical protein